MAGTKTAGLRQIRCPVCLKRIDLSAAGARKERLLCPHCRQAFDKKNALPVDEDFSKSLGNAPQATDTSGKAADPEAAPQATPSPPMSGIGGFRFMVGLTAVLGLALVLSFFAQDLNGPDFLVFYAVLFFVTLFGGGTLRAKFRTYVPGVGVLAWLLFEAVGGIRIIVGLQKGMHKFSFLIAIMIVGGIVFLMKFSARFSGSGRGGDGGGFFFLGGCGGCGGGGGCGGCGGGGCGGCGG
jgi:hypothetical protein